jgi:alpha-methylacyl-CoA racemase
MTEGAALLGAGLAGLLASGLWTEGRGRNVLDGGAPWYDTYETADGGYVAVGAIEARFYARLLEGLGLDPRSLPPRSDRAGWPVLRDAFANRFRLRTRDEWTRVFEGSDACVSPVLSLGEARDDPQLRARAAFFNAGGIWQPAPAPRCSETPSACPQPAPARGTGGDELIGAWGVLSDAPPSTTA